MTRSWLLGVSFAALLPVSALGQDEQQLQLASLEPVDQIVVYGTKQERSLEDVTASVNVTTAEEILREPIVDLYDVINRIPNVSPAFGRQGFSIRGVDQRGTAGNGATLTVYVDDSPLSNQTTFFGPLDSWDLQQVEVYRGPQSTNFGRNALAGAIYVRTQDPTYEWDLRARGEYGNNGVYQGAIAVGGPIIDDKLAFRFSANYRESDGFITNTFLNEEADATELETYRLKLLVEPTSSLKVITTSSYTENFAGEDIIPLPGFDGTAASVANVSADDVTREVTYDTPGREGTETFIQSVNATWTLSERFDLQSITTYQDTDYVRFEDFDGTSAPIAALDRQGGDEAWSEELRLRYNGDRFSGVVGFYFFDNEDGFNDSFTVPGSILGSDIPGITPELIALLNTVLITRDSSTTFETTNYAGFFDGEYQLTDRFDLLFGLRYDYEEFTNSAVSSTDIANPPIPSGLEFLLPLLGDETQEASADYEAWLPKGGVRWKANSNATFSFVVQRAYRAGGGEISVIDGRLNEFDPEFLWNYEIGARTNFFDGRLLWNTNVYYSDWTDQQVALPFEDFPDFSQTVNAASSTLFGVESDVTVQVTDDFEVYGGIGYANTEFDDYPNGNFNPALPVSETNQDNFAGNRFAGSPVVSLNFGFDYQHTTGFFGGVDVNYSSDFFPTDQNLSVNEDGARTLVNARAGYQINENVRLSGYVQNAFDEQFFGFINREFGTSRLGDERTYAVRLDFDF
ncbi:MAG: TonB-dependent receptor [Pseudomonadota bacterium]